MTPVQDLTTTQLFDKVTQASYYGPAFRQVIDTNPRADKAMRTLVACLRTDAFLFNRLESDNG